jgi:hypothetical protein
MCVIKYFEFALAAASYDYIPRVHMNKRTLLNDVVKVVMHSDKKATFFKGTSPLH